ncbi:MAG: radical SAM protein [Elusimicrobia bacterium]|nr:radical SAM protein [Elusimicrobiota bacterium]
MNRCAARGMVMALPKPKVMILFSSFRCDARCVMCYTWVKQKWSPQLSLDQLRRIVSDPLVRRSIEIVNLAGGEPTLRPDLVDLVELLVEACPHLKTVDIPTNGFQTDRVVDQIERLLAVLAITRVELAVTVSIDGVGVVHETIRGRPGIFPHVNRTVEALTELRTIYPRFRLGMNTVISRHNAHLETLEAMRAYARSHRIGLNFTPAAVSEIGVESVAMTEQFEMTPEEKHTTVQFFERLKQDHAMDERYADFVLHWLRTGTRNMGCAFREGKVVLVEPTGDVFLCGNYRDFKLGNLLERSFSDVWPAQRRFTREMWRRRCDTCASNCYIGEA